MFDRSDHFIRKKEYHLPDLVPRPRRLALMNLFLHGVEPHVYLGDTVGDPDEGERYDVILTKGKQLVLNVGARITSANQKWMEVPGDEDDRIDILLEFTNKDGNGTGKGLCLRLKAGNSHFTKRKTDGPRFSRSGNSAGWRRG